MIRARFQLNINDGDYRPIEKSVHPYWCTGWSLTTSEDNDYEQPTMVAYADSREQILELWPEATNIATEEVTEYVFTDRFPNNMV
jgi:hypothetical protein